jgi:drug/metabolite transporter (DMT)-like permease
VTQPQPAEQRRLSTPVLLAIAFTLLCWATAFIVIRGVSQDFGGGALALGRLAVGAVVLAVLVVGRRWVRPTGREWLLILSFGIAWFAAYNVALNIAEQTLDAGTTAMVVNIGPLLIAIGAGLFLGEGFPRWLVIGAAVAFVGVVLIGVAQGLSGIGDPVGLLWALLAAVTYAIGVLCQKTVLRRVPSGQVTFLGCAIGAVACLPFAPELVTNLVDAPLTSIIGVVYLGVFPTALAFSTWGYVLTRMPASQLGVTTYIVPPLVVLFSFLVFGEVPAVLAVIGGAVCLVGVALSRRTSVVIQPAQNLQE